uniref:FYVE-type domain-containing protein n=1 Tax=Phytophthora ramorum TaxID=164328 RepID=H3GS30_PHYRM
MRFRLPAGTFPELELAKEDMDNMEDVAAMIVDSAIDEFERLRLDNNGLADKRWKPIKRKAGVMLYEDRSMRESLKRESTWSATPPSTVIHSLMAFGTTRGELNELMFGLLNPTREEMLAKSACTGDYLTDCAELASIISPTPSNPLRSLQVKWSLIGRGPMFVSMVIRPRDFVYLESTGIALDNQGEHVGFNLRHSVEVPGVRELGDHQIVRANISFCRLFRQKREGLIEVYMSGCVDAMGYRYPIYTSIVITQIADALLSFQRLLLNARMKKLAWMLNNKKQPRDASKKSKSECSSCGCNLGRMILSGRRECTICRKLVCPPCRVPLKVAWKPREDPNLFANENQTTMKVRFEKAQVCRPCLHIADRTDALDVAIDEIRRASPLLAAESGMAVTSASSLFSLINSDKFDRDCFFHSYQ